MPVSKNLIATTGPPEWPSKRLKVTFKTGLPKGIRAEFEHEGSAWIAYPSDKSRRIEAVLDQLLSIHDKITEDLLRMINDHPENAARVAFILKKCAVAKDMQRTLTEEKMRAVTS